MHAGVLPSEQRVLAAQEVASKEQGGKTLAAARRGVQTGRELEEEVEKEQQEEAEELCESDMIAWLEAVRNKEVRPLAQCCSISG